MKKLFFLVAVFVAVSYQSSYAQVSFDLNISSGPNYAPVHYAPIVYHEPHSYYVPVRRYYAPPKRMVIVERHGPMHFKRTHFRPSAQHYSNRYYHLPPRIGHGKHHQPPHQGIKHHRR